MLNISGADIWKSLILCGAMAFLFLGNVKKLLKLAIRIFDISINFVRGDNFVWLQRRFRQAKAKIAADRAVNRAKKGALSKILEHTAQSTFLYPLLRPTRCVVGCQRLHHHHQRAPHASVERAHGAGGHDFVVRSSCQGIQEGR